MFKAILLAASIALASFGAYAEEAAPAFEYKLISISDRFGGDIKVHSQDMPNGIFVTAVGGWSSTYNKAARMLSEKLKAQGFKVVDKPEDADIGIQIVPISFNLEEVETGIDAGFDKANAAVFVAGAFLTGGITIISELSRPDTPIAGPVKGSIETRIFTKPKVNGRGKMSGDDDQSVFTDMVFQSNDEGFKRSTAAYQSFIERLVKDHFIVNEKPADSAASYKAGSNS